MKKHRISIWIAALALAAAGQTARAAMDSHGIAVRLHVNERFGLSLDRSSIDLGRVTAGSSAESGDGNSIRIGVKSNHGLPWSILLQASPLVHADGVTRIPEEDFKYVFSRVSEGGGETPLSGSGSPVPTAPQTIFTGGADEPSAALKLGVRLDVPPGQKAGDYSTTLNLTLADSF